MTSTIERYKFTADDSRRGQAAATESRRQVALRNYARSAALAELVQAVDAERLPDAFLAACVDLVFHATSGQLPEVTSTADLLRMVEAADKLHKMGRLAAGQSTANTATLHMDAAERDARTAELRARLAAMDADSPTAT
jgi:hypothetical protein